MDERRSTPRWQIDQAAELTVENGVKPIACVVEDISLTGMRISMGRNLFDEVFSNFKIALNNDFEFSLGAQVVWRGGTDEKNIYGLAFNKIEELAKNGIWQYVKKNFPGTLARQWWRGV